MNRLIRISLSIGAIAALTAACTKQKTNIVTIKGKQYQIVHTTASGSFSAPVNYHTLFYEGRSIRCEFESQCVAEAKGLPKVSQPNKPAPPVKDVPKKTDAPDKPTETFGD